MKILIIGTSLVGGGRERSIAYKNFLVSQGFTVDTIQFPGDSFSSKLWYYYQRGLARFVGHEKRHMRKTADRLESRIKAGHYDVVIGVETPWSYVLTRDLGCLKIFSCESLESEELRFSQKAGVSQRIQNLRVMELEMLRESDYSIFPWKTTENYARENFFDGKNFVTIKYGCYPQRETAVFSSPVSVVSLGCLGFYWSNRELLSYLTKVSPYNIDVYGSYKPPKRYSLNYLGFAPSLNVLTNYQFGLSTISKDVYRQNHFSSRILTYLSFGLPVLSPDWMKLSHELRGVLPYNENNFLEVVEKNSKLDAWTKLSKDAHEQAVELDWSNVVKPLLKIVSS